MRLLWASDFGAVAGRLISYERSVSGNPPDCKIEEKMFYCRNRIKAVIANSGGILMGIETESLDNTSRSEDSH